MDYLTKRLTSYDRKTCIQKRGACHPFSHAVATLMLEGGPNIRYIQELLGHRSLNTRQIYTHLSPKLFKEVYERTHPGKKTEKESLREKFILITASNESKE